MRDVGRLGVLRELCGTKEPPRVELHLLGNRVVDVLGPKREEMVGHPAEHHERSRADELDVDLPLVHVRDVASRGSPVFLLGDDAAASGDERATRERVRSE